MDGLKKSHMLGSSCLLGACKEEKEEEKKELELGWLKEKGMREMS